MLTITRYQVNIEVLKPIIFTSFPGFYIRNALVKAMVGHCSNTERVTNQKVISCRECSQQEDCTYFQLNLPVEEPVGIPGVMPFILDVSSLIIGKYQSGTLQFGLTLFGNAKRCIHQIMEAVHSIGMNYGLGEKGQAGNYRLCGYTKIADTEIQEILNRNIVSRSKVSLYFSQLKLSDAKMHHKPSMPPDYLVQLIETRIHDLVAAFGDRLIGEPLIGQSLHRFPAERLAQINHSEQFALCNYQYTGTGVGHLFLSGWTSYEGAPSSFDNLIEAGSLLGIGRFTSYGFGTYTLK